MVKLKISVATTLILDQISVATTLIVDQIVWHLNKSRPRGQTKSSLTKELLSKS